MISGYLVIKLANDMTAINDIMVTGSSNPVFFFLPSSFCLKLQEPSPLLILLDVDIPSRLISLRGRQNESISKTWRIDSFLQCRILILCDLAAMVDDIEDVMRRIIIFKFILLVS